jgi:hypothetical protein
VLASYERTLEPDHPLMAVVLVNLGWLYHQRQQEELAEDFLRRGLAINEEVFGKDSVDVYNCLDLLAQLFIEQHRYEDAYPVSLHALQICQQHYGSEDQRTSAVQARHLFLLEHLSGEHPAPNYQEDSSMRSLSLEQE